MSGILLSMLFPLDKGFQLEFHCVVVGFRESRSTEIE